MSISDNKFQKEQCEKLKKRLSTLSLHMLNFYNGFGEGIKPGDDTSDIREHMQSATATLELLQDNVQDIMYSNMGEFVLFDVGMPKAMNFLKKVKDKHGPEGIIKVGDTVEFDPGVAELGMLQTFASMVKRPRGKVVGFITQAGQLVQDIVVAKDDGKCFVMHRTDSDFDKKYKISRK